MLSSHKPELNIYIYKHKISLQLFNASNISLNCTRTGIGDSNGDHLGDTVPFNCK